MGSPNPSPCFLLSLPKPSPPHSWKEKLGLQMVFLKVSRFFSNFPMSFVICQTKTKNACPLGKRITPISCVLKNIAKLIPKSRVMCRKNYYRLNRLFARWVGSHGGRRVDRHLLHLQRHRCACGEP